MYSLLYGFPFSRTKIRSAYVIATNLSFHIILNPTWADFLQNHGKSASFLCWENERKHLILLTFSNVTLL